MPVSNEEVAIRISAQGTGTTAAEVGRVRAAVAGLEADTQRVSVATRNWSGAYQQLSGPISTVNRAIDRGAIGLAALTGGAVAWGLKTASSYELSRSALGALLGDVDKGNTLFKQLQSYNLEAPFDFSGIANAEQTLIQFGIAGDKALPVLKGIGDVAAMTSNPTQNLQSMALALGQISSAGVMRAQDMNQLVQAGFPAYQLLAEVSGKTSLQLRKDMETGMTVPADQFVAAIESMQGQVLARYKDGAKKQNDTLYGQWSNFKDLMARNLEKGIRPSLPEIKKELPVLANAFADAIDRVGPQLPGLVTSAVELAPALIDITTAFAGLLGSLAPVVEDLEDLMGPNGVKALLVTLLGFRAATGVAGIITTLAGAYRVLAGAEAAEAAARGAGGAGGIGAGGRWGSRVGRAGLGAAGLGIGVAGARGGPSIGGDAATVGGLALGGAEIGSFFPGPGTVIGGAVGAGVGAGIVTSRRVLGDAPESAVGLSQRGGASGGANAAQVFVGGITVNNPASTADVKLGVLDALKQHVRDREDRR